MLMGTWGVSIFEDDFAADVRDGYFKFIDRGIKGHAATDALLQHCRTDIGDEADRAVFWIALALTQWKYGLLEERVKLQALQAIDSGGDVSRWEEEDLKLGQRRKMVLIKAREALTGPAPNRTKKRMICDWNVGEILGFESKGRTSLFFWVKGFTYDEDGIYPYLQLLDWNGEPPSSLLLKLKPPKPRLEFTCHTDSEDDRREDILMMDSPQKLLDSGRLLRLDQVRYPGRRRAMARPCWWRNVDKFLATYYGVE